MFCFCLLIIKFWANNQIYLIYWKFDFLVQFLQIQYFLIISIIFIFFSKIFQMHFLLFPPFLLIFTLINHENHVYGMLAQGSRQLLQRGFFMVKGKPIGTFLPKTVPKTVKAPPPLPKQPISQTQLTNAGKTAHTGKTTIRFSFSRIFWLSWL